MFIEKLPTENLYKFTFIAGLSLILSSLYIFSSKIDLLWDRIEKYEIEKTIIDNSSSSLNEYLKILKNETDRYKSFIQNKIDSIDINTTQTKISKYYELAETLKQRYRELKLKNDLKSINSEQITRGYNKIKTLFIFCILMIIIGYRLMSKSGTIWNSKVQELLDKKLKLEVELLEKELKKD